MEGGSPQLYLKTFGQSSEADKGLQKWDGGAGTRTSAWAHLLLCSADAWSRRRINTVFFCCVCASVRPSIHPSIHLLLLRAKGNSRASKPQINFRFVVAEWRLEMHGLLWPRFISPFSSCSSSLAQWHPIRKREGGREGWKRGQEEERGRSEKGKEGALTRSWKWIKV